MPHILLIENDPAILQNLQEYLRLQDFQTTAVSGQRDAQRLLEKQTFDLLLVDIALDDGDGFSVCKAAKEKGLPVIFLTASGDEGSAVRGLDMGADDYITKPFRPRELVSRIRNILRRYAPEHAVIQIGDLRIDADKGTLEKGDVPVSLSALEWRLLMMFLNNRGKLLTRDRLLEEIWDIAGDFVNDNTLTVYIKRLREKLETDPQHPTLIQTQRGRGYRMD
ncbi:MAG: response regulator transcription factor [Clostridia bacterium]|nr:response regulator transcription factor [Clostridia bacterium]